MSNLSRFPIVAFMLLALFVPSSAAASKLSKEELCEAVQLRKSLSIVYKNDDPSDCGTRIVEPYLVGVGHNRKTYVYGYQISGCSSSGGIPDYRTFRTDLISNSTIADIAFSAGADSRKAKGWDGCFKGNCFIARFECE